MRGRGGPELHPSLPLGSASQRVALFGSRRRRGGHEPALVELLGDDGRDDLVTRPVRVHLVTEEVFPVGRGEPLAEGEEIRKPGADATRTVRARGAVCWRSVSRRATTCSGTSGSCLASK